MPVPDLSCFMFFMPCVYGVMCVCCSCVAYPHTWVLEEFGDGRKCHLLSNGHTQQFTNGIDVPIINCCVALFVAVDTWRFVPFQAFVGVFRSVPTIGLDMPHFSTMAASFTFVFVAFVCVFLVWAVCRSMSYLMSVVAFPSEGCQSHFCVVSIVARDCFCLSLSV